jgi:hypothetical protein
MAVLLARLRMPLVWLAVVLLGGVPLLVEKQRTRAPDMDAMRQQ